MSLRSILTFKEVVEFDLALHHPGIFAPCQPVSGDDCDPRGVLELRFLYEGAFAMIDILIFFLVQDKLLLAEFHLADIDDMVGPFNDDVDLRLVLLMLASPGIGKSGDGINAQRLLDLHQMSHTYPLVSKPHP